MVAEWHACENRFGSSDGIGHHKARGGVESESSLVGGITASGNLSDLVQEGGGLFSHAAPSLVSKSSKRVAHHASRNFPLFVLRKSAALGRMARKGRCTLNAVVASSCDGAGAYVGKSGISAKEDLVVWTAVGVKKESGVSFVVRRPAIFMRESQQSRSGS